MCQCGCGRRRSKPNLLPEEFLVGPTGVHEDTDGVGTRAHGISCSFSSFSTVFISEDSGLLLGSSCQSLPCNLPLKEGTLSGYCGCGGSGAILSPTQSQFRFISAPPPPPPPVSPWPCYSYFYAYYLAFYKGYFVNVCNLNMIC